MFQRFLKPKWQHKDPKIRIAGIQSLDKAQTLIELANNDPEISVRKAAIEKISTVEDLLKIKSDGALQSQANTKLSSLLRTQFRTSFTPEIGERLTQLSDHDLYEHLALKADDLELRKAAVNLVSTSDFLSDLAVNDTNAGVRNTAAARLNDEAIIRKTLKKLGKRDKRATQTLRTKLDKLAATQEISDQLDHFRHSLKQLGNETLWQRDQTRLNMLLNQSQEVLSQAKPAEQEQFANIVVKAEQRIQLQHENSDAQKPVIETKEAQSQLAEDFCSQLKQRHRVSLNEAAELNLTMDTLLNDWNELPVLEEKLEATLSNRFHAGITQARKQIGILQTNAKQSHNLEYSIRHAENLLKQPSIQANKFKKLVEDWDKQTMPQDISLAEEYTQHFSRLKQQIEHKLLKQTNITNEAIRKIETWLNEIEASLDKDQLGNSEGLRHKIEIELKALRNLTQSKRQEIEHRLQIIHPKIRDLSGWRHWGTDRAREELIEEAIKLKDEDQSIEKRVNAVKDLRKRWKALGKIDPVSQQRLWKKFDLACEAAYAPCKAEFEQQAEQRKKHLQQREQICIALEELAKNTDWTSPDWRAIDKRFQQLRNQWRNAGSVSRQDWKLIFNRFNSAVDAVNQQLQDERRISLNRRTGLIEQLETLAENSDLDDAIQQAKSLQRQWQVTVTTRRGEEQKLWKRFRAASDAVFNRDKERRQVASAENREIIAAREELCAEFEDRVLDGSIAVNDVAKFEEQWAKLEHVSGREGEKLNQRLARAKKSAQQALHKHAIAQQKNQLQQLFSRKILLDQFIVRGKKEQLDAEWKKLSPIKPRSLEEKMQSCYESIISENPEKLDSGSTATANTLLLDLEITLELESPIEIREQRMSRQIERLSNKLSDGDTQNLTDQAIKDFTNYCQTKTSQENDINTSTNRLSAIKSALEGKLDQT